MMCLMPVVISGFLGSNYSMQTSHDFVDLLFVHILDPENYPHIPILEFESRPRPCFSDDLIPDQFRFPGILRDTMMIILLGK